MSLQLLLCILIITSQQITATDIDTQSAIQQVITLTDGTIIQLHEFTGPSRWSLIKHLFTSSSVTINCHDYKSFSVYTGRSIPAVKDAYKRKDKAWCGWDRFTGHTPSICTTSAYPLGHTVVAIAKSPHNNSNNKNLNSILPSSSPSPSPSPSPDHSCTLTKTDEFSMPRFITAIIGAFLFWSAPVLSESTPFRLASGTLSFVVLSGIILTFMLYKSMPHKKKLLAIFAMLGSSAAATARWVFGTWLPSTAQILQNPLTLGYFLLSGLAGLAFTYYFNDVANHKINTILRVGLQLVGLALVGLSAPSYEISTALLAALLSLRGYTYLAAHPTVGSAMQHAKHSMKDVLAAAISPLPRRRVQMVAEQRPAAGIVPPLKLGEGRRMQRHGGEEELEFVAVSPPRSGGSSGGRGRRRSGGRGGGGGGGREESPPTPTMPAGWTSFKRAEEEALHVAAAAPLPPKRTALFQQQQQEEREEEVQVEKEEQVVDYMEEEEEKPPSPLVVERGVVLNEETGRLIQIGKGTYTALLEQGYVVDVNKGTISPPPEAASGGSGGSAGGGSGGKGGTKARRRSKGRWT